MAAKLGRQGYALVLTKINSDYFPDKPWAWAVETQNGVSVAESTTTFRSRWDARRQATRLLGSVVAVEKTVYESSAF